MSNVSASEVYSEKKIAAYEGLFRESPLSKPQEVYLTVTVAHLFGEAYIMEQQGTKEGEPVYSRFVCPLEEITKVYINDNVKASPLFIQCDTNIKGVVHRKRIIVPCLENVAAIVDQIEKVRAQHMEKYEAAIKKEQDRKREALEAARKQEQLEQDAKSVIPPLPAVAKFNVDDIPAPAKAEPKPAAIKAEAPKPTPAAPVKQDTAPKTATAPVKSESKPAPTKPVAAAELLNNELEQSMKALEDFSKAMKHNDTVVKPVISSKVESAPAPKAEAVVNREPAPKAEPIVKAEPAPAAKTEPVVKAEPAVKAPEAPAPKTEAAPAEKPASAPVITAPPVTPVAASKPARVNPTGQPMALEDFQTAARKLRTQRDAGEITPEQYNEEKQKLLAYLY